MKVAIIGRGQALYDTAIRLKEAGHEIGVIITAKAAPEYTRNEHDFDKLARTLGVPFFVALVPSFIEGEFTEKELRGCEIGVSINWPWIIGAEPISWFKHGILNAHMGDLPRYRGNACASWAILNGEDLVVITIHKMVGGQLDYGKVICHSVWALPDDMYVGDIYQAFEDNVPDLFLLALSLLDRDPGYEEKYVTPDDPNGFRCYPRMPQDGFIDWFQSAEHIHRLIRASGAPFKGAYTYQIVGDHLKKLIILESYVIGKPLADKAVPGSIMENNGQTGESRVYCGWCALAITKCRYSDEDEPFQPGKRWKSIRMRLGVRPEDMVYLLMEQGK